MGTPPAPPTTPPLLLFLLFPLLLLSSADPDDITCLTNFHSSLIDPTNSLSTWNESNLLSPCGTSDSPLHGATCINGRIFKLSLPSLSLSGSLSPFLSNCSTLQSLDLSSNSLSSSIPNSLSLLSNLAVLNLSRNLLIGPIPPSLAASSYLNVIDLSHNRLSGPIPSSLASLSRLSSFDVSFNRLSGLIPPSLANRSASLPRFNSSSFQGNKGLYGYPLSPYRPDNGLSVFAIVGIGLGSGLLSLVVSFAVVCVWLTVSERKLAGEEAKISHLMPDY